VSHLRQLAHQVNFDLLIFRRNPAGTFFTLILPIIFLVIFTSIFGNEILEGTTDVRVATFYVPGILALAIVGATTVNLAITMTTRRERGVLKRLRGTPMPTWVFTGSQAIGGIVLSLIMTVLIVLIGRILFDVELRLDGIPSLLITLFIGAASFSALGLAMTIIIPSEDAAPAVTNAIMLPLYFISDVFLPGDQIPDWVRTAASIFPIQHLSLALQESFNPLIDGLSWPWKNWLVIAAWGLGAAFIAVTRFRWTPRR
jgi:ABC-2 type transport system permease protein